ncbi:hypothetical protein N8I74_02850 [Chitiniphilus purpureus]|uniref:Uncharacterized protein n=1 Tax=Chitiniphilus purpureus TaxID=2981137 RepID=A0ABY6DNM3_9NEIS|nr:hypothetical protein [Chitiniphilus sp. CD1]UXY15974.1 hypothetical protein N8I74_02850 [Chitiniphilus sp. CD1]
MKIVRAIEVWEKGLDGAFVGHLPVADTLATAFLYRLFKDEQDRPDPDMKLSYMLDAERIAQLQPYVAQQLDPAHYDYILTAYGVADPQ